MSVVKAAEVTPEIIGEGRSRYLAHMDQLMVVVIDFKDGPMNAPDPPHSHPHEQISYVVSGELLFFLDEEENRLSPGDIIKVPPNLPHTVQLLSEHVRLVDTFHPIRKDFI